jgi:group I intron endonuclease
MRGVYAIVCDDGRSYVGSSIKVSMRWATHRYLLRRGAHGNRALQEAWDQQGPAAFRVIILEEVATGDLLQAEQRHIDRLLPTGTLFNRYLTAGSARGLVHTAETRAGMSIAKRGENHANAKLTNADILTIRTLRTGGALLRDIGARFGLTTAAVSKIANRQTWSHVSAPEVSA